MGGLGWAGRFPRDDQVFSVFWETDRDLDAPLAPKPELGLAPGSLWSMKMPASEVDLNGGRLNSLAAETRQFIGCRSLRAARVTVLIYGSAITPFAI